VDKTDSYEYDDKGRKSSLKATIQAPCLEYAYQHIGKDDLALLYPGGYFTTSYDERKCDG